MQFGVYCKNNSKCDRMNHSPGCCQTRAKLFISACLWDKGSELGNSEEEWRHRRGCWRPDPLVTPKTKVLGGFELEEFIRLQLNLHNQPRVKEASVKCCFLIKVLKRQIKTSDFFATFWSYRNISVIRLLKTPFHEVYCTPISSSWLLRMWDASQAAVTS